jgi:hypothetical protein
MSCEEFWKGDPRGSGHLEECRACAVRFERQRRLAAGLNLLGRQARGAAAPARVERALVAEFRAHGRRDRGRPRPAWWPAIAWVSALAATAVFALVVMRPQEPRLFHSVSGDAAKLTPVDLVEAPAADGGDEEFIPLPNAEQIAPNEEVNLVRVEVPRSAMIALGFNVPEDRAAEPVEADVMLGPDGVARAVRFLDF